MSPDGLGGHVVSAPRLHAVAWAWWAAAAVVTLSLAPNPTYVALVLVVAAIIVESHAPDGPLRRGFPLLVGLAAVFAVVRVVLTALTTHGCLAPGDAACADVLVRLPEVDLPVLLGGFALGGTIELPVVLRAASEAFVVVGVVAAFAAFNAVVSHHELVRLAPRAFHELGLVVTVALAFVPSTLAAVSAVREADRARSGGRIVRRGRVRRLALPVIETGMERALRLAESMDARGFGHHTATAAERAAGWVALASLVALTGAFVGLVAGANVVAAGAGGAGVVLVAVAVGIVGRAAPRARYRPARPTRVDLAVMATVAVAPIGVTLWAAAGGATLDWQVRASELPPFDLRVGALLLTLAAPALRPRRPRLDAARTPSRRPA